MPPRKPELARRGDLEIEQEIINYKNSLSQVFEKLQNLQDQITELKSKEHYDIGQLHSEINTLKIDHDRHVKSNFESTRMTTNRLNDINEDLYEKNMSMGEIQEFASKTWQEVKEIKESSLQTLAEFKTFKEFISLSLKDMKQRIEDQTSLFRKEVQKTKQEILSMPSEIQTVRQFLIDKIESHKINVLSVFKEMNILKKENFIVEKKLEALFTEIDNLKMGKK